jgi:RNA ligase (TIGR02306 family)
LERGQYEVGETVIYCEIDSYLPIREEFEFLRKSSYLKMEDGKEGFRLKTMKLRGQISQGLILKLDLLNHCDVTPDGEPLVVGFQSREGNRTYTLGNGNGIHLKLTPGTDVSEYLKITKYEKPIPKELEGMVHGYIDGRIKKTDEERIQNLTQDYEEMKQYAYFESEKLDGESFTAFVLDERFGVCTRQLDLILPEEYSDKLPNHLKYALKNDLEKKVRLFGKNIALQGELIGPGIKKNKYNLEELELHLFNIFDIDAHAYYSKDALINIAEELDMKVAPVMYNKITLPDTVEELLKMVEGKSYLNNKTEREGSVFVSINSPERISFKVISNKYLLKGGE